jgi:hypothetical protein
MISSSLDAGTGTTAASVNSGQSAPTHMPIEKEIFSDSIHFIFLHLPSFCDFIEELVIDPKDFFLDDLLF